MASTFRSWAASQGISFEVAEAALAHMGGPLKQAYQRSDLREIRRGVMEAYAQFLSGEDDETGNVVSRRSGPDADGQGSSNHALSRPHDR